MKRVALATCLSGLLLATATFAVEAARPNLNLLMVSKINPLGLKVWDITNPAIKPSGGLDGKKISTAQWAQLLEIGKGLEDAARTLATSDGIVAAAPGARLQDATKAADIQRYLDAKPALFRQRAQALQKTGADLAAAATRKDLKVLADLSNDLDGVCEDCHTDFWYPQQKK